MDSSGSMKKTDPQSLRIPAAKLFISLLDEKDSAGIISFSERGYLIHDLTPVSSEQNRSDLFAAAEKITSEGLYTNLFEAFNSGFSLLKKAARRDREQIIVLMSDGMMDTGNPDEDKKLSQKLSSGLAETLKEDNIRVYTIAFTQQSDRRLLEKISKKTGGFYNLVMADRDLHVAFTSIFESLKSPDMLPVTENGFVIDSSIEEVTIVATKSTPETEIEINAPDGQSYTSDYRYSGIDWFVSENFDMITVLRPVEGQWDILFSTGSENRAYVITNLKLQTNFEQLYAVFGENMVVKMWLEKDGEKVIERDVLDKIDFHIELTGPAGNTTKLQALSRGEGEFQRKIVPFTPGNYRMKIVAKGMTFERAKIFPFNVADLQDSKEDIKERRAEKKKLAEEPEKEADEPEQDHAVSWKNIMIQFISMNIIIGVIAFLYFKRKNLKSLKNILSLKALSVLLRRKKADTDADEGEIRTQDEKDAIAEQSPPSEKEAETKPDNPAIDATQDADPPAASSEETAFETEVKQESSASQNETAEADDPPIDAAQVVQDDQGQTEDEDEQEIEVKQKSEASQDETPEADDPPIDAAQVVQEQGNDEPEPEIEVTQEAEFTTREIPEEGEPEIEAAKDDHDQDNEQTGPEVELQPESEQLDDIMINHSEESRIDLEEIEKEEKTQQEEMLKQNEAKMAADELEQLLDAADEGKPDNAGDS
jgi:hypothetical protein